MGDLYERLSTWTREARLLRLVEAIAWLFGLPAASFFMFVYSAGLPDDAISPATYSEFFFLFYSCLVFSAVVGRVAAQWLADLVFVAVHEKILRRASAFIDRLSDPIAAVRYLSAVGAKLRELTRWTSRTRYIITFCVGLVVFWVIFCRGLSLTSLWLFAVVLGFLTTLRLLASWRTWDEIHFLRASGLDRLEIATRFREYNRKYIAGHSASDWRSFVREYRKDARREFVSKSASEKARIMAVIIALFSLVASNERADSFTSGPQLEVRARESIKCVSLILSTFGGYYFSDLRQDTGGWIFVPREQLASMRRITGERAGDCS